MSSSRVISQACGECRARKIKCDLQRPECDRCVKSGRQCPGYRDHLSLRFRDESQTVAQRTKATGHSSPSIGRRTQRSIMEEAFGKVLSTHDIAQRGELFLLPMETFEVDVQDQATCYFFEVFDWVGASTLIEGSFDHSVGMENAPLGERALLAGISAVGKASIANIQHSDSLRESASDDYVTTLKFVNMALGNPEQMKEDSTLTAIFLLSTFELIVGQDHKSIDNWLNHVGGAARLLDTRGRDDLSKNSSPSMFYTWRTQILQCCLARKTPVPSTVQDLSNKFAAAARDPVSASMRDLTTIIAKLAQTRHDIERGELTQRNTIISQLESINADLDNWIHRTSPSSRPDEVPAQSHIQISPRLRLSLHKEYVHKYSGYWAANMWNQYRTTKLQLNDMILAHLHAEATMPGPISAVQSRTRCTEIRAEMRTLADDICSSAPYIFGFLTQERSNIPVRSATGALMLLWPLTAAALADPHPSPVAGFCFQCFDLISEVMGIRQATVLRQWALESADKYMWADSFAGGLYA